MVKRLLCLLALVVALGCQPVTDVAPGSPLQADDLTPDGGDRYILTGDHALAVIAAPSTNVGNNTRIAITTAWQPPSVDQSVCATWNAAPGTSQPGLMLRWDGTHGISLTRNVWGDVHTVIQIHQWDTSKPVDVDRFTWIAGFPLNGLGWPGPAAPFPWRACAWATGTTVRFKIWPLVFSEPADSDPCCTGTTPVAWLGAGRAGWYAGHIPPGATLVATGLVG